MRKLFATVAAVSALMAGAVSAQNLSILQQGGFGNAGFTNQGGMNFSYTGQFGNGNLSTTNQQTALAPIPNFSGTLQVGDNNTSTTNQWGAFNISGTGQFGDAGHTAVTTQVGGGNLGVTIQTD